MNGMELREGSGNEGEGGREGDKLNVVWIVDSTHLPFYRAEDYHQCGARILPPCHLANSDWTCTENIVFAWSFWVELWISYSVEHI